MDKFWGVVIMILGVAAMISSFTVGPTAGLVFVMPMIIIMMLFGRY